MVGILGDDSRLVWLGNVGKHNVNHADKEPVVEGLSGIMDDRDHVGSLLRHVDEVSARPVRELNSIDDALRADNVGDVGDGGPGGSAQVQNLGAWHDVGRRDTTNNCGCYLGSVRVPHPVLDLLAVDLHADSLLVVDALAWDHVLGQEGVLAALGDVDSGQTMSLHEYLGATSHASSSAATSSAATVSAATSPAATVSASAAPGASS